MLYHEHSSGFKLSRAFRSPSIAFFGSNSHAVRSVRTLEDSLKLTLAISNFTRSPTFVHVSSDDEFNVFLMKSIDGYILLKVLIFVNLT